MQPWESCGSPLLEFQVLTKKCPITMGHLQLCCWAHSGFQIIPASAASRKTPPRSAARKRVLEEPGRPWLARSSRPPLTFRTERREARSRKPFVRRGVPTCLVEISKPLHATRSPNPALAPRWSQSQRIRFHPGAPVTSGARGANPHGRRDPGRASLENRPRDCLSLHAENHHQ